MMNLLLVTLGDLEKPKNHCYNHVISKRDLAKLAFNGLWSHIKEKLEGHEIVDVAQVLVRALAHESRSKDTRLKSDRPNMHLLDYESSDDESKDVCAAEFTWLPNDKANTCASLKLAHKSRDEMKFTFDVAKCDKIFDELFNLGKIKTSHTISPLDQLKRRAYCKYHNSFSHATNDCNTFHRQIQSATNEVRLKFHEMQVDENPFPNSAFVNTLELSNLKVLIRPDQAENAKGKNVIIGKQRHSERQPLEVIPKVSATSTLGGQDKIKKTGTTSTGLTGAQGQSYRCLQKGSKCSKPKKKARPSFNELLDKYKREGATKDRSNQPNGAKGVKAPPRHKGIHH
jgi:hypothetical protein